MSWYDFSDCFIHLLIGFDVMKGMLGFASYIMANYHIFGATFGGMVNIIMFALNQHSSTATVPILLQPKFFR
jgi:hypothetical protein